MAQLEQDNHHLGSLEHDEHYHSGRRTNDARAAGVAP